PRSAQRHPIRYAAAAPPRSGRPPRQCARSWSTSRAAPAARSRGEERKPAGGKQRAERAPRTLLGEVEHAAEVAARTAPPAEERARRARNAGEQDLMPAEIEHRRIGGAEERQRRNAERARHVHGAAVVGGEGGAAGDE